MRYIKFFVLSGVFLLLCITAVTLLLPSSMRVSRATNLYAGSGGVLKNVSDLSLWKNWYPGFDTLSLEQTELVDGRVVKATVKNIRLHVVTATDSLVTVEMYKGQSPVYNNWKLIRYQNLDSLTLQNYIDFKFGWLPWDRFSGLLTDQSYGHLMETGLKNLRALPNQSPAVLPDSIPKWLH